MSRAQAFREKRQWEIELPDGLKVLVRKPSVRDMVKAGLDPVVTKIGLSEDDRNAALERQLDEFKADTEKFLTFATDLCALVMVDPKLHIGADVCPSDAITREELGDNEVMLIATELMVAMAKEVGDAGKLAARFRVDAGGSVDASSGAALRDEPVGDYSTPAS